MTLQGRARDIAHYFEYSNVVEVIEDGLREVPFGEYLVERGYLTRQQLFMALCEQDRHPGVRLGEVVAALGYMPYPTVDSVLTDFNYVQAVEAA